MNIYLAGPMRGLPSFNFPAFHAAAAWLRRDGYKVFSPAERDEAEFGPVTSATGDEHEFARNHGLTTMELRRRVFAADAKWICETADAVALLPGWEHSRGAQAEKALAEALGLAVIYL